MCTYVLVKFVAHKYDNFCQMFEIQHCNIFFIKWIISVIEYELKIFAFCFEYFILATSNLYLFIIFALIILICYFLTARICSVHFEESDFFISLRHRLLNYLPKSTRTLKRDAVPSLLLYGMNPKSVGKDCSRWKQSSKNAFNFIEIQQPTTEATMSTAPINLIPTSTNFNMQPLKLDM